VVDCVIFSRLSSGLRLNKDGMYEYDTVLLCSLTVLMSVSEGMNHISICFDVN